MTAHRPVVLVAILTALLTAGCSRRVPPPPPPLPLLDPPRLTIEAVAPGAIAASGVVVEVRGRMENPNPVDLPVTGFDYAIEVDGKAVDARRLDSQLVLPAGGVVGFAVPAHLRWTHLPETVVVLATRRTLALRVSGAALVAGVRPLPWVADATVALPLLPEVSLERSRIREKTLLQTTLELALRIRNPNDFPLPVGRLHFDLSVSGSVVASAASHALDEVPPHGEVEVLIPVKFSPVGTVAAAVGGVLKLQANVHLKGRAGWGELEVAVDQKIGL